MNDRINIEEILNEHRPAFADDYLQKDDVKKAIKEIVEAVVDKCGEEGIYHVPRDIREEMSQSILQVKQLVDYD